MVEIASCIRGHNIYKAKWKPATNEVLECCREMDNLNYPDAVAVIKGRNIVGYIPTRISTTCFLFQEKRTLQSPAQLMGKDNFLTICLKEALKFPAS